MVLISSTSQTWPARNNHGSLSHLSGHSSITMMLDLYSHAIPAMQADAADRVAALIEAAGLRPVPPAGFGSLPWARGRSTTWA